MHVIWLISIEILMNLFMHNIYASSMCASTHSSDIHSNKRSLCLKSLNAVIVCTHHVIICYADKLITQ